MDKKEREAAASPGILRRPELSTQLTQLEWEVGLGVEVLTGDRSLRPFAQRHVDGTLLSTMNVVGFTSTLTDRTAVGDLQALGDRSVDQNKSGSIALPFVVVENNLFTLRPSTLFLSRAMSESTT